MRRSGWGYWIYLYALIGFAWCFAFMWNRMADNRDPALHYVALKPRVEVVRKVVITRRVDVPAKPGTPIAVTKTLPSGKIVTTYVPAATVPSGTNAPVSRAVVPSGTKIVTTPGASQPVSVPATPAPTLSTAPATPVQVAATPAPAPVATATS